MTRSDLTKIWCILFFLGFIAAFPTPNGIAQPNDQPPINFSLKKCWEYSASGLNESGIAADRSSVYLSESDARVESISADTGARLWATDLGGKIISNIFVGDSSVYVATRSEGPAENHATLWALSKETGLTTFTSTLNGSEQFYLVGLGKRVFVISDGLIIALDGSGSGSVLWNRAFSGNVSAKPVISNDRIIIGVNENLVLEISVGNGEIISKLKTQFVPTAVASPDATTIVIGDERGNLWSGVLTGESDNWKFRQGARISDIEINGDNLFVTSFDNFIYLVDAGNGKIIWKKRMPGRVSARSDASKEVAITVSKGENTAFVINIKNGKSINQLVLPGENSFVQQPVIAGNSAIFPTAEGVFGYGMAGCPAK